MNLYTANTWKRYDKMGVLFTYVALMRGSSCPIQMASVTTTIKSGWLFV